MSEHQQSLDTLKDIKKMMERSSRFISLSGWSGVAAGVCALIGAWFGHQAIERYTTNGNITDQYLNNDISLVGKFDSAQGFITNQLVITAALTFVAAFVSAFLFTYFRSKKTGVAIWGSVTRRLFVSMVVPMFIGGLMIIKLMQVGAFVLIAPSCLFFYGLALVNASRYTFGEIKYLGYGQLLIGILSLFYPGYGLYFWAFGFGVLHIFYGTIMWWKYERDSSV